LGNFYEWEVVTDYDGDKVHLKSGKEIPSNNVIWAAGVTGNVIDGFPEEKLVRNRYIVDRYNKIKGYDNIYAIGDIAYMETPKYPQGHPQVANVAINQAKNLGKNLLKKNQMNGKNMSMMTKVHWQLSESTEQL
jgi:NADH dehydrogenase